MCSDKNEKIYKIRDNFKQEVSNKRPLKDKLDGVYVFVSFDLVDSTRYKNIENDWSMLIQNFYQGTYEMVKTEVNSDFKVWKYVGDEILLFLKVNKINDLIEIPSKLYKVMNDIQLSLEEIFPNSKGLIYLKGTVFVAKINEVSDKNEKNKNYILQTCNNDQLANQLIIRDFLGPDIDLGFRLTKHSHKNQLVVSLELVYLITKYISQSYSYDTETDRNFRVMKLIALKGIWHNRKYPVIWFKPNIEDWKPLNLLEYDDDLLKDEDLDFYLNNYSDKNEHLNLSDFMSRVLRQSGKIKTVDEIIHYFADKDSKAIETPDALELNLTVPADRITEVHYVLIGINIQNKTVAVFKKTKGNETIYDFGCVHSDGYTRVIELVKNYYNDLYKEMDILMRTKDDDILLPVSMYEYENRKRDKRISGFMFVASIEDITGNLPEGYEAVLMKPIDECKGENFYSDSQINLNLAFERLREKINVD